MSEEPSSLDRLRPRIRPRRFYELDARPKRPFYRPLAHLLGVGLAFDREKNAEYIEDPKALGYAVEELEARALANLKRIHERGRFTEIEPRVWRSNFGDDFAVERMLLADAFDELALDGDPVVFPASEEMVFVVGANDEDAQAHAFRLAHERGIDFAFVRRDGTWAPFVGEGEIAETQELRVLFHLGPAYALQFAMLTKRFEGEANAPALADFKVHSLARLSATRWRKDDARTWLPRTSVIELDDGSGDATLANWDDIVAAVPGALEPVPDEWPELFETKRFPPPEVLAKLRRELEEPVSPRNRTVLFVALAIGAILFYLLFGSTRC